MITPKLQTRRDRLAGRGLRSAAWRRRCVGWVIDAAGVRVAARVRVAGATYKVDSVRVFDISSGFRGISKKIKQKKLSLKKISSGARGSKTS